MWCGEKHSQDQYCHICKTPRRESNTMSNKKAIQAQVNTLQATVKSSQAEIDKLNKLLEEKEHRFYFDQPVLVSHDGNVWAKRFYKDITSNRFVCYGDGRPSRINGYVSHWEFCKPDPEAPSLLNWIEWEGGECPVDGFVITQSRAGEMEGQPSEDFIWRHDGPQDENGNADIVRYAVITKPEFI
jgi:hypothetical protein